MSIISASVARALCSSATFRAATAATTSTAAANRWYSVAVSNAARSAAAQQGGSIGVAPVIVQGHSTKKLVILSGASACATFDACYYYYNFGPGSKRTTSSTV